MESTLPNIIGRFTAVITDMDGVLTRTAEIHAEAWKRTFDPLLDRVGQEPFDLDEDYRLYVDGKPRLDGIRNFLRSRGIQLPDGGAGDATSPAPAVETTETVFSLGEHKNALFGQLLREKGAVVFQDTLRKLHQWRDGGLRLALVTSSRNSTAVLESAGLTDLFPVRVDGVLAAELNLPGKPAPDYFLEAARRLGVSPTESIVLEDAISGIEAGKRGGFGLVIGVDRGGAHESLAAAGADLVVRSLDELDQLPDGELMNHEEIPLALPNWDTLSPLIQGQRIAVFLDYDGTLTPIVPNPEDARLSDEMRAAVAALADHCFVAVVSGRDLADVQRRVGLEKLHYAGSHGFDIQGPGELRLEQPEGQAAIPLLDMAQQRLNEELKGLSGVQFERKKFSLAVHYRHVTRPQVGRVRSAVDRVVEEIPGLRPGLGKEVLDLRPNVDWGKGRAVAWLMERMDMPMGQWRPVFIGDDVTDEEAFEMIGDQGFTFLVSDTSRPTAARWRLNDTEEVIQLLRLLTTLMGNGTAP